MADTWEHGKIYARPAEVDGEYKLLTCLIRADDDELVKKITESFLGYRNLMRGYMPYADNGQMNARMLDYKYD